MADSSSERFKSSKDTPTGSGAWRGTRPLVWRACPPCSLLVAATRPSASGSRAPLLLLLLLGFARLFVISFIVILVAELVELKKTYAIRVFFFFGGLHVSLFFS